MIMKRRLLLFASFCSLWGAEPPGALAIRNARVVPVSGPPLARATVVVRNGLIEAVGVNVTPPADAWVVEGEGLVVYPGLIDAFSSAGLPAAPPAASGPAPVPAVIARGPEDRPLTTSWLRAADLVRPGESAIESARARGFTSGAVFPNQGLLAGQGAIVNFGGATAGRMIVVSPAGQAVSLTPIRGSGFRSYPSSPLGVYAYLRQLYIDLAHYQKLQQAYMASSSGKQRPPYDRALEGLAESPRLLLPATTLTDVHHVLGLLRDLRRPAVLHGLPEGYRAAALLQNVPVILTTKWPVAPEDADPDAPVRLKDLEVRDLAPTTPAELVKARVKFAFKSDGQSAADMLKGVRTAMARGLKSEDALRALTLSAAEIYGVADRLGSIDAGKIANLVVTKGDLLGEKPEIQFVLVDGIKYAPVEPAPPGRARSTRRLVDEVEEVP